MTSTASNTFKLQITAAGFTPPYPVPTVAGQVVTIAGRDKLAGESDAAAMARQGYVSSYPTNVSHDVQPGEMAQRNWNNAIQCESHYTFLSAYSPGGAIGNAGTGGHHGMPNFGGYLFDFTDARHKRIWTGGTAGLTGTTDIQYGTLVHNIAPQNEDLYDSYSWTFPAGYPGSGKNHNPDYWTPTTQQSNRIVRQPDPRDQFWEITRLEPYPYAATESTALDIFGSPLYGPRGWTFPGQWAGMQGCARRGMVGRSKRFNPLPWPSTIPMPAHCWDFYFELLPAYGGGPKGTVVSARHQAAGDTGTQISSYSFGFDLATGLWSQISINDSQGPGPSPAPWLCDVGTNGAFDRVKNRFFITGHTLNNDVQLNYFTIPDKTWRGIRIGQSTPGPSLNSRVDNLTCDPDRRLLLTHDSNSQIGVWAFDLALMDGSVAPADITASGRTGFRLLPITIAPGTPASKPPNGAGTGANPYRWEWFYEPLWVYYPPNGKFYRYGERLEFPPNGNVPTGQVQGSFTNLQRLTPPAINAAAQAANPNYYFTQPWVYDEINVSTPMVRGGAGSAQGRYPKRLRYVPTLQCLCWIPLDHGFDDPITYNPVYLIKPF